MLPTTEDCSGLPARGLSGSRAKDVSAMTNRLSLDMLKATGLTRAGRLMEATELLQRILRGKEPPLATHQENADSGEQADNRPSSSFSSALDVGVSPFGSDATKLRLPDSLGNVFDRMKRIGVRAKLDATPNCSPGQALNFVPAGGEFLQRRSEEH